MQIQIVAVERPAPLTDKELDEARQLFAAGRLIAQRKAPYFQPILLRFVMRECMDPTPAFHTMGVTDRAIGLWCPHWVLGKLPASWFKPEAAADMTRRLTPKEVAGVLLHECGHVLGKHGARRGARDGKMWNMAGDYAINPMVAQIEGVQLPPGGCHPKDKGWEEHLTADEYYGLLLRDAPPQQPQKGAKGQGGGQGKGKPQKGGQKGAPPPGDSSGDGEGDGQGSGGEPGAPHPGRGWCGSCAGNPVPGEPDGGDPEGRSEAEMERAAKDAAEGIRAAAAASRGSVPGSLVRMADAVLLPPKVDWRRKLRGCVRQAVQWAAGAVDTRYDRPSVRQAGVGYGPGRPIMPRLRRPVPRVLVAVDTSGSMGEEELTRAVAETVAVAKAVNAQVDMVAADAKVQGVARVRSAVDIARALKGGGGTLYQPVLDHAVQSKPKYDVVVFLCDGGCFDRPVQPRGLRVVWVLVGRHRVKPCAWGEMVEVDEDAPAAA